MDEQELVQRVTEMLREQGGTDEVLAAGIFFPRGHTGAMFAGGFVGDGLTSSLGNLADSVGTVGGALAGAKAHDAASGLPERMIVAVTSVAVLGFDTVLDHGRRPTRLIFALARGVWRSRSTRASTCASSSSRTPPAARPFSSRARACRRCTCAT